MCLKSATRQNVKLPDSLDKGHTARYQKLKQAKLSTKTKLFY